MNIYKDKVFDYHLREYNWEQYLKSSKDGFKFGKDLQKIKDTGIVATYLQKKDPKMDSSEAQMIAYSVIYGKKESEASGSK